MSTLAQGFEDQLQTLRTLSMFTAGGLAASAGLLLVRRRIPVRVLASLAVIGATLLAMYVSTGIQALAQILQSFAPAGRFDEDLVDGRAWWAVAGAAIGLVVSGLAVVVDSSADGTPDGAGRVAVDPDLIGSGEP